MSALTNAFQDCKYQYVRITGTGISITSDNIIEGRLQIDRTCTSSKLIELGSTIASDLTVVLDNSSGAYDNVSFVGQELFVELGCDINSTITYLPCGVYVVDTAPRKQSQLTLKAMDRMITLDHSYNFNLSDNITVEDLITLICTDRNITCATDVTNLPNYDYEVSAEYLNEYTGTMRQLIGWCAFLMGTCAMFDGDGQLIFKWFTSTGESFSESKRVSGDLYESNNSILGLVYTDADGNVTALGNDQRAISYKDCGILAVDDDMDTVLNNIYSAITGFTYRPFTATVLPSPWLYPMDVITYVKDNTNYAGAITAVNFTVNGNTALQGVGETTIYENSATKSTENSELSNLKQELSDLQGELEVKINGNFDISDELTTNIKSYFLHGDAYYNKARKTTVWNNTDTYIFVNTPSTFVAQQTHIEDSDIYLLETTYSSGDSYSYSNTVGFEIGGQQVYYTAIGSQTGAYQSYTFTDPRAIYGNNVDVKAFEVRLPRSSTKTVAKWDWENYSPKIVFGTGNITGYGKGTLMSDLSGTSLTHTGQYDGLTRGIAIIDDGVYYNNGASWKKLGGDDGNGNVKIIDHAPTVSDLTGENTVFVRYDSSATPVVDDVLGTIYESTNTYVEVPKIASIAISPEGETVYKGYTQQYTGYINGTAQLGTAFTWSVAGNTSSSTTISDGLLSIGSDEQAGTIQITATSIADSSKSVSTTADVEEMVIPTDVIFENGIFNSYYGNVSMLRDTAHETPANDWYAGYFGLDNTNSLLLGAGLKKIANDNIETLLVFPNQANLTNYTKIGVTFDSWYTWNGAVGEQINAFDGTTVTPVYGPGDSRTTVRLHACFGDSEINSFMYPYQSNLPSNYARASSWGVGTCYIEIPTAWRKQCYFALSHIAGAWKLSKIWFE